MSHVNIFSGEIEIVFKEIRIFATCKNSSRIVERAILCVYLIYLFVICLFVCFILKEN